MPRNITDFRLVGIIGMNHSDTLIPVPAVLWIHRPLNTLQSLNAIQSSQVVRLDDY